SSRPANRRVPSPHDQCSCNARARAWHSPCSIVMAVTRQEGTAMQAVVGVVRTHSAALRIVEALRRIDVPDQHISVLSPSTPESALQAVPKTDAEQPGIGGTIGGVVGGAAGTAGGLSVAALALTGVGPVIAAGANALG